MKKKILAIVLATSLALSLGLASAALAWQEGPGTDWWYIDASYGDYHSSVPLVIQLDGNPSAGQTFYVGETITISGYLHAVAQSCGGDGNGAYTEWHLEVAGPSGPDSTTDWNYDSSSGCAVADEDTTLSISYTLTAPGTHTVYMSSYAAVSQYWTDVADDYVDDLLTFEVSGIEVEKNYRYTNVCFEKDNDLDGLFNEDPVDFDPITELPIDNDGDGFFNEDDIDCPLGTYLGDELPMDAADNYLLEAVVNKNGKVRSYNPGQYYAVSTVNVLVDVATLTIVEEFDECTEPPISVLNPKKGGGRVVIVQVGPGDDVAYQILDANMVGVTVTATTATAVLGNVSAGTTILMYVKFGPGLKGETWNPPYECENYNEATAIIGAITQEETASANLKVVDER